MSIFRMFGRPQGPPPRPENPQWARGPSGYFRRFSNLDPEAEGLEGRGGVFVIWHGGLRPRWVYVGASSDLAASFHLLAGDDDIMAYEVHGGLSVTWALIREEFQLGVLKYLSEGMRPLIDNPQALEAEIEPIPVVFPGKSGDKPASAPI